MANPARKKAFRLGGILPVATGLKNVVGLIFKNSNRKGRLDVLIHVIIKILVEVVIPKPRTKNLKK